MDDSEIYVNVHFVKPDSTSPSRNEPDLSYAELKFKTPSAPWVRTDRDRVTSIYTELKFRKEETRIDEDEDPPISSGPGGLPPSAQTAAQERESKEKIGNRHYCIICLLCLVMSALIVTVAGLSIYVSQMRQSKVTSDRNYQLFWEEYLEMNRTQRQCRLQVLELNSTTKSKISENSHLDLCRRTSLKNLSALNSNLSDLIRMNSDLCHQFTEMETKYRSVNETKAQICELLTSRREQTCSQDWIRNEDRCYFISTFETSYERAKQLCSVADSMLLEINSKEEENFVNNRVRGQNSSYWTGTCKAGEAASNVVYKVNAGKVECGECKSPWYRSCNNDQHRFICEKSATLYSDIPVKIRDLCQQPVELTLIEGD